MERIIIDILGWTGTILFLIAYGLVSSKKVEGDSWQYQGLNLIAGVFLIINTVYLREDIYKAVYSAKITAYKPA